MTIKRAVTRLAAGAIAGTALAIFVRMRLASPDFEGTGVWLDLLLCGAAVFTFAAICAGLAAWPGRQPGMAATALNITAVALVFVPSALVFLLG